MSRLESNSPLVSQRESATPNTRWITALGLVVVFGYAGCLKLNEVCSNTIMSRTCIARIFRQNPASHNTVSTNR